MSPHTSTYKGKRVYVRLKSGERIVGKFEDKKAKFIRIDDREIPIGEVKAFAIFRAKTEAIDQDSDTDRNDD
jgi:hypothetical protein